MGGESRYPCLSAPTPKGPRAPPQRGKARWWVRLCRCGGPSDPQVRGREGGGQGQSWARRCVDGFASPEWEPCPGAWKTGDAAEPNFLMARERVLTTRRVCLASGRCDGHSALRSPRRLLAAGAHAQGPPHTGTCRHTDTCLPSHTQLSHSHTCALMHTYTHTCLYTRTFASIHSAFTLTYLCSHAYLSILTLTLVHAHMLTPVPVQFLPTMLSPLTHTHGQAQPWGHFGVQGEVAARRGPASGEGTLCILVLLTSVFCATERRGGGKKEGGEVTCGELDPHAGRDERPETRFCRASGSAGQVGVFRAFWSLCENQWRGGFVQFMQ